MVSSAVASLSRWLVIAAMVVLGGATTAEASHFRGVDMWASVDASGVVTITSRTRWRKDFGATLGIDPARFGLSSFSATAGCPVLSGVSPATGMRISLVNANGSTGADVLTFMPGSFSFNATLVSIDTSPARYTEILQVFVIPLGSA